MLCKQSKTNANLLEKRILMIVRSQLHLACIRCQSGTNWYPYAVYGITNAQEFLLLTITSWKEREINGNSTW